MSPHSDLRCFGELAHIDVSAFTSMYSGWTVRFKAQGERVTNGGAPYKPLHDVERDVGMIPSLIPVLQAVIPRNQSQVASLWFTVLLRASVEQSSTVTPKYCHWAVWLKAQEENIRNAARRASPHTVWSGTRKLSAPRLLFLAFDFLPSLCAFALLFSTASIRVLEPMRALAYDPAPARSARTRRLFGKMHALCFTVCTAVPSRTSGQHASRRRLIMRDITRRGSSREALSAPPAGLCGGRAGVLGQSALHSSPTMLPRGFYKASAPDSWTASRFVCFL
ncbi:hypothetical protein CERSUDRAFT_96401 [Gelatoporia subvermispora B]|uniref:Uncharacterized protein n=1 Tax=Ceriporiopsis subvermispora (strain B) TaxID=914234 RepID=M2PGV2_CERS8|nr:hypothetical protein CERSUDRAFT_96401 [Gelatoporia subvermispora B]